eukprot:scaffold122145_cov30-Phaeocystis_antarctica.AAC.1
MYSGLDGILDTCFWTLCGAARSLHRLQAPLGPLDSLAASRAEPAPLEPEPSPSPHQRTPRHPR